MLKQFRNLIPAKAAGRGATISMVRLAAIVAVLAIVAGPAYADFAGLARKIEDTAQMFAGPFAVVSVVVVGSYVAMGHAQSGEQIRNLILGLVFLGMAVLGGAAILSMVAG